MCENVSKKIGCKIITSSSKYILLLDTITSIQLALVSKNVKLITHALSITTINLNVFKIVANILSLILVLNLEVGLIL